MSHYLVQKSSVPVMVARRRLRRCLPRLALDQRLAYLTPTCLYLLCRHLKRTDPSVLRHTARVSLAEAGIEKTVRPSISIQPQSQH